MSSRIVDLRGRKAQRREPPPVASPRVVHAQERKVSPVRVKRRQRRLLVTALIFVLLTSALGVISYASYQPRFSVQEITVRGNQALPSEVVTAYVNQVIRDGSRHVLSRANIFVYPRAVIERDLVADFPRIAAARISRPSFFSTTLVVTIEERALFARWCKGDSCYDMDNTGFIFAEHDPAPTTASNILYRFTGGVADTAHPIGKVFAAGHVSGLVAFLDALGQAGYSATTTNVSDDQDFVVPVANGFDVLASFGGDTATLIKNLSLVLRSGALLGKQDTIDYIDLRFGNRVYYKLKGENTAPQSAASSTPEKTRNR